MSRRKSNYWIRLRVKLIEKLASLMFSVAIILCFVLVYAGGMRTLGAALMSIST